MEPLSVRVALGTALMATFGILAPAVSAGAQTAAPGDTLTYPEHESLPPETVWALEEALGERYRLSSWLNPYYLRGDFDGGGRADVAVLVRERASDKLGIAVLHAETGNVRVLGAGVPLGNGADDFVWMDYWRVQERGPVERGAFGGARPRLTGDAMLVGKSESASALLYWDGRDYVWYQQGD